MQTNKARKTQPMEPRSIVTSNLHASQVQRPRYRENLPDRFFPFEADVDEDATISPGDALFTIPRARVLGNTKSGVRSSYVTAILNNVEIEQRSLIDGINMLEVMISHMFTHGFFGDPMTTHTTNLDNYDTVSKFNDNRNSKLMYDVVLHCAMFLSAAKFKGLAMSDTPQNKETAEMKGEHQVAGCQHGALSLWNSGDGPITQGDDVYLWLPPAGDPRQTGFKKPRYDMRAWSPTRKAAVFISGENLLKKVTMAIVDHLRLQGTFLAGPAVARGGAFRPGAANPLPNIADYTENSPETARLMIQLRPMLRHYFRSAYVGKCLTPYAEQQYYFDVLRLM